MEVRIVWAHISAGYSLGLANPTAFKLVAGKAILVTAYGKTHGWIQRGKAKPRVPQPSLIAGTH